MIFFSDSGIKVLIKPIQKVEGLKREREERERRERKREERERRERERRERQRRERERKERESEIERALASADVLKFELLSNDLVWFGT